MHIRKRDVRAYADGQLPAASREAVETHLSGCPECQAQLEALQADNTWLDEQLQSLAPAASQRPRPEQALARMQAHLEDDYTTFSGGMMLKRLGLSRSWQRALSGLAAVAVVAVLLSFAPVRAAASEFLSVFRVERIVVLPVSIGDLEDLERVTEQLGEDFFPGSSETLVESGDPAYPESAEEASELAGFAVRVPTDYRPADEIIVHGESVTRFVPDVEMMQVLFETAGLDPDLVPSEIDGEAFDFAIPTSVMQIWGDEETGLMVSQAPSPSISFPDEVDEQALGLAMLQLLGLSPDEAEALSASIDWSTTLVLPIPTDEADFEEVAVDGATGFLFEPSEAATGDFEGEDFQALLWEKNGTVYFVAGAGDSGELLEIANSLR